MAQSLPSTNIDANVGPVSGGSQVAVGSHILQIGHVEGGVVYVSQGEPPAPRPINQPIMLRPRAFPRLLDRVSETETVVRALESKECVECSGEQGSGKTSLLRHLSYHPRADAFPSGVIYFQVNRQSTDDLLKSLFDAFYEYDSPLKPTETQIRHYLQSVSALILLDDVETAREQTENPTNVALYLMNVAPNCTFITASTERSLLGEAREVILKGLPADEALTLFEREFGRALSEEERAYARALCESLGCNPRRILRAASQAREEGRLLPEFAVLPHAGPVLPATQAPAAAFVKPRSEDEDKVLSALAVFYGAPVRAEHLAAVAGVQNAAQVLGDLEVRSLVQSHDGRYSLTEDVNGTLRRERDLTPWLARALWHFAAWAELSRQQPKLIAAEAQPIQLVLEWGVAAKRWVEVRRLGHAAEVALALCGKWDAWAVALQCVLKAARAREDKADEAWALHQLGTRALCLGKRSAAEASLNAALSMRVALNDTSGAAVTRHNLQILLSPPGGNVEHDPPPPPPPPLSLLYKLTVTALLLMSGATVALRYWPSKPIAHPASIVAFSASPATVAPNAQAQLCYEVLDASSARIEPDIGERKPATKECLTVTPQQTTVYTLTANGLDGSTISRQITVNVEAPPPAPSAQILSFAVERRNGLGGAGDVRFQLCYGVRDADRVEIDNGVGEVAVAEQKCVPIKPEQTTVYTLTATGSDGRAARQQVTVDATKPPPPLATIPTFDPSPASIVAGETAQLCYQLRDASSAHIVPGVGEVNASSDRQCVNVAPRENTTYTLTALNPEGKPSSRRANIAVTPPAPKVVVFNANPDSVETEGRVRLCYETTDASRVEISNGVGPVRPADKGCAETFVQLASKTFTLTATGRDGRSASRSVTVTVNIPSPEISLSVNPESIQSGETARLCYSVANVKSFGIDPGVAKRRLSSNPVGVECVPVQPKGTTTYTLNATGLGGQTVSTQATLNVTEPPQKHARINFFEASETSIKAGASVSLCYGVSDAVRVSIHPVRKRLQPSEKNCVDDSPKQSQTYTLNAVGEDGHTESRDVTVEVSGEQGGNSNQSGSGQSQQPPPLITRLEIKKRRLGAMQLCYAVENASAARVEPDFGDVKLPGQCMDINANEPRTYTLTATGFDGQTKSESIEYTPPPKPQPIPIRINEFTPAEQTIGPGAKTKICYSTFGEGSAQISPEVGSVMPSIFGEQHCKMVAPKQTTVYTLTVRSREGQPDSRQVRVIVRLILQ